MLCYLVLQEKPVRISSLFYSNQKSTLVTAFVASDLDSSTENCHLATSFTSYPCNNQVPKNASLKQPHVSSCSPNQYLKQGNLKDYFKA